MVSLAQHSGSSLPCASCLSDPTSSPAGQYLKPASLSHSRPCPHLYLARLHPSFKAQSKYHLTIETSRTHNRNWLMCLLKQWWTDHPLHGLPLQDISLPLSHPTLPFKKARPLFIHHSLLSTVLHTPWHIIANPNLLNLSPLLLPKKNEMLSL